MDGNIGSRLYQGQRGENGKSSPRRELMRRASSLYSIYICNMIVSIVRASCPTVLEREFILHSVRPSVSAVRISVVVDEFTQFLSYLYRAYASLSRQSYGEVMRMSITCEVNGRKFSVRVEDGGLRYGVC